MSFAKDIGKTVTGFLGATGRAPQINAPTFGGVRTPSLNLDPSGVLSRRPGAGQRVPTEESRLLDTLSANRAGIRGLAGDIPGIRSQLDPLKARGEGFFGRTAELTAQLAGQLPGLIAGHGRITEARAGAVRSAASKAVGNVRSSFRKRDILGANFAQKEIASIAKDFANEEDRVRAESFIQELQAQQQIIAQIGGLLQLDQASLNQQATLIGVELGLTEAEAGLFAREIQNIQVANSVLQTRIHRELNELNLASGTITQVLKIASDVAVEQAKLEAEHAKGQGKSLASGIEGLTGLIGTAASALGAPSGAFSGNNLVPEIQGFGPAARALA
ncbi:MAG TPA: hypothetical protein VIR79_02685 [Nitrospira sp.]